MSGTFTWIDDLTLVFYPDAPLEPASDFKVSLNNDVRAVNGLGLLQPVSFNYRTVDYLRPVQLLPRSGAQDTDPTSAIVVAFNYPVVPLGADQAGLPAGFDLQPSAEGAVNGSTPAPISSIPSPPWMLGASTASASTPICAAPTAAPWKV